MSGKLILDMEAMQEDFFADTALIGIVSALPHYRFCWLMNQKLDIEFAREPEQDIMVQASAKRQVYYSIYKYQMPLNGSTYTLYQLKRDKDILLPEVKQLDYLWMVQSASAEEDAQKLIQHLREIPEVQLAQVLSPERMKNLSHLIL